MKGHNYNKKTQDSAGKVVAVFIDCPGSSRKSCLSVKQSIPAETVCPRRCTLSACLSGPGHFRTDGAASATVRTLYLVPGSFGRGSHTPVLTETVTGEDAATEDGSALRLLAT